MQGVRKGQHIGGKDYRSSGFYWAVLCRNHISCIYPRHAEARQEVYRLNSRWEAQGWTRDWRIVRFRLRFKGTEIDAYAHTFERTEVKKKRV